MSFAKMTYKEVLVNYTIKKIKFLSFSLILLYTYMFKLHNYFLKKLVLKEKLCVCDNLCQF